MELANDSELEAHPRTLRRGFITEIEEPRFKTTSDRFKENVENIRREFTIIEERRVKSDFMYMMLSAKDKPQKHHHIKAVVQLLKNTFVSTDGITTLNAEEISTLDKILRVSDEDTNDVLWFVTMRLTPSLLEWFQYGEVVNGERKQPPAIKSFSNLEAFMRGFRFEELITGLKDGSLSIKEAAMAFRSEYAMNIGFRID